MFYKYAANAMGTLQSFALYRRLAGKLMGTPAIEEATVAEVLTALGWLNAVDVEGPGRRTPRVTNLVAKARGKLLGFVQLVASAANGGQPQGFWICSLIVRTRYRGMGIGEALSTAAIEIAERMQAGQLILSVAHDNLAAIRLYRKLGFRKIAIQDLEAGLERDQSLQSGRRILMRKELQGT